MVECLKQVTDDDFREDIRDFEDRIQDALNKLSELPEGLLSLKEHKKRERIRRDCESEIEHVKRLIGYAQEALNP